MMRNVRVFSLFAALLLFGTPLVHTQAADSPLPEEAVAAFSRLVGTWSTEGIRNDTEKFTGIYQARWNDSKTGLILFSQEGGEINHGVAHWDPETKCAVENWVGASGLIIRLEYQNFSQDEWTGMAHLMTTAGTKTSGTAGVTFGDGTFEFRGNPTGGESLVVKNTRTENAAETLRNYAAHAVGGRWVSRTDGVDAIHEYRWLPGQKVLAQDRDDNQFPGAAFVYVDSKRDCVIWNSINSDIPKTGNTVLFATGEDQWRMIGHGADKETSISYFIDISKNGKDTILSKGYQIVDGQQQPGWERLWERARE